MRLIALLALSVAACLAAADPFDAAAFESGWKPVGPAGFAAAGVASDGARVAVAWGATGYVVSRDGGIVWTQPVLPTSGAVGAPGSVPVAVGSAVVAVGGLVYVRADDGAVHGPDGQPRNRAWQIGAVTALAAAGDGTLFAEVGDGRVVAVAGDRVVATVPGRLVAVFYGSALVVTGDGKATLLRAAGATPTASPFHASPSGCPLAIAPSVADVGLLADATALVLAGGTPKSLGAPPGLQVSCFGGGTIKTGGFTFVGLGLSSEPAIVALDAVGRMRRLLPGTDLPAGLRAVAPVASPDVTRYRLVGATDSGIQMFRSRL